MKIKISYTLYTDGDYSLRNFEEFGCTDRDVCIDYNHYDYLGEKTFEDDEVWRCKHSAKIFLQHFLCDGIHISYTHYYLIKHFYEKIENLITFINENNNGEYYEEITGNYDGTVIKVEFLK